MKKSNVLLLGGFLLVVLLISAIHITLYAKYKAGDFTIYNAQDDLTPPSMQLYPNILFVSVRNVPRATVKFSDVAAVEKGEEEDIQYLRRGDTLLITGSDRANQEGFTHDVAFNLPYNATVSVFNSSLFFQTGKKTAGNNPVIYLKKSWVLFSGADDSLRLGHIKVVASDSSTVAFGGNTLVNHLDVQLSRSSIKDTDGNFDQLSIVTDSLSRISLQAKHLVKANIKTTVPE